MPDPMRTRLDFQPYVNAIASRMRLGHWRLEILDEEPENKTAIASIDPWHGRCAAYIRFADSFLKDTPEDQRYTVVHELVHCHLAHADALVRDELAPATETAWVLAQEHGVDQIAMTIAPSMPLPNVVTGLRLFDLEGASS